jgi:hypothetical protein
LTDLEPEEIALLRLVRPLTKLDQCLVDVVPVPRVQQVDVLGVARTGHPDQ